MIFVIEFKDERQKFELADQRQVEDYALDLSDFHQESNNRSIIPILLAPYAKDITQPTLPHANKKVQPCLKANSQNLALIILNSFHAISVNDITPIDPFIWANSAYQPTPTIIQAALALFAGQKVEDITKSGAGAENIKTTTSYIIAKVKDARAQSKKIICFVTGVPGAGKTLVGLNIVHEKAAFSGSDFDTAFLSGNVPLIKVLKEALTRDHYKMQKQLFADKKVLLKPSKKASEHYIDAKIQNLHSFIKDGIRSDKAPVERIGIFDEAQGCWDADHFYNKSKQNENRERKVFTIHRKSEAEMLLEFMDRHEDWAVIIALVGGGQEINTGEAGIREWGKALETIYKHWEVHISPDLLEGGDSTAGKTLFDTLPSHLVIHPNKDLHLSINQRSFKANNLNEWVNAVLANEPVKASTVAATIQPKFPILITRDLQAAKGWLRSKMGGTKRIGLVTSSGGLRLRPYGVFANEAINEAYWFLNDEQDIRSSYFLEVVAKEFVVQGLELDWVGICWDADLRRGRDNWEYKSFAGTKWQEVGQEADRQYLINTYRVLLTRAREGIVIWIPEGSNEDGTRLPSFYNPIYEYLKDCGAKTLEY